MLRAPAHAPHLPCLHAAVHVFAQISVNRSTPFSQVQRNGPTGSAYVTYYRPEDALRCIEAVDGLQWDGERAVLICRERRWRER